MSSAKGKLVRLFGGMVLNRATVVLVEEVGEDFRRLVLRGDAAMPKAGTKLEILLPSDDMRTYTPIPTADGIVLLGWKRAGGPGARWMSQVELGEEVCFSGPSRSLVLPDGPVILVGDETSIAVAAAFEAERPGRVQVVLEVGSVDRVRTAAESVGLRQIALFPTGQTSQVIDAVVAMRAASPQAVVALTGGSDLIRAVRAGLRTLGMRKVKTRAY